MRGRPASGVRSPESRRGWGLACRGQTAFDFGPGALDLRLVSKRRGAFAAELGTGEILKSAVRTAVREGRRTLDAELQPLRVVRAAAVTAHALSFLDRLIA